MIPILYTTDCVNVVLCFYHDHFKNIEHNPHFIVLFLSSIFIDIDTYVYMNILIFELKHVQITAFATIYAYLLFIGTCKFEGIFQ